MSFAKQDAGDDPAEAVARVSASRRGLLLRVHRRRLGPEDLEDCYSQATLELLARSRRTPFLSREHILNSLEQKFRSRIEDRRRAIGGRSAIESALARAVSVHGPEHGAAELEDRAAVVERQVIARSELRRLREVIGDLSRDQQLVLASHAWWYVAEVMSWARRYRAQYPELAPPPAAPRAPTRGHRRSAGRDQPGALRAQASRL